MSSTWELKEKSTGELKAVVEGENWQTAQKKAFNRLAKKVNLPGFRPGSAPTALVKKQISTQNILMEAIDDVAGEALTKGIEEHDLWVVSRPSLDIESIDEEKVTFKFTVSVKPEVTLGDYKSIDIKKDKVSIKEADLKKEIENLQERFADLVLKETGKVENGDTAVIDFEGFKDEVPFEGGKGENYPLVIGSGSFIPGFEEQVLGMKTGDTKDLDITFPEEYQVADLAGQPVVFKVTVHEIKEKVLPEANDDLVKQAKIEDVETIDAYKEYMKKSLKEQRQNEADQKFENDILTAVCDASTVEIPDVMVEEETDNLMRDFAQRLQSQGLTVDQFMQFTGNTEENIRGEMSKDAFNKVKVRLVLEAIAAEEKLAVNEEEVETEMQNVATTYNMPIEKVKELISKDAVSYDLRIRKALDFIKDSAGK